MSRPFYFRFIYAQYMSYLCLAGAQIQSFLALQASAISNLPVFKTDEGGHRDEGDDRK